MLDKENPKIEAVEKSGKNVEYETSEKEPTRIVLGRTGHET